MYQLIMYKYYISINMNKLLLLMSLISHFSELNKKKKT